MNTEADRRPAGEMSRPAEPRAGAGAPVVVVIDGEIGAGKSTLISAVRDELVARGVEAAVVPEPVEDWKRVGILQEFYENRDPELRKHIAYEFQTYTAASRIKATREVAAANPGAKVYLLERSILTDRYVFMELQRELVGPMLMTMYDSWWEMWAALMPFRPTMMVYLKPSLENCMRRVARRGREGEVGSAERADETARGGVSIEYQARLRRAHEAYLEGLHSEEFPGAPVIRPFRIGVDVEVVGGGLADGDFSRPGPEQDAVVAHIADRIWARAGVTAPE